jgi:hypothetical protein
VTRHAPEPVELTVEPTDPAADDDLIVTGRPAQRRASARLRVAVVAVLAVALAALVVVTRSAQPRQPRANAAAPSAVSSTPAPAGTPVGQGVETPVPSSAYTVYPSLGDDYPVWAFVDIVCRASGDTCTVRPDTSADLTKAEATFPGTRYGHGLAIDATGRPVIRVLHLFLGSDVDAVLVIGRARYWIPVPDHPTVAQAITRSQVRGDWRVSAYLYGPEGAVLPTASAELWLTAAALP